MIDVINSLQVNFLVSTLNCITIGIIICRVVTTNSVTAHVHYLPDYATYLFHVCVNQLSDRPDLLCQYSKKS